jgi:hypothetical protein
MSNLVTWLGWICYADAAAAIVVYLVHFGGRQGWRRPWNAAGLFFTAIAMTQAPSLMQDATGSLRGSVILTVCLVIATGLQAMSAMRRRRRREDTPATASAS